MRFLEDGPHGGCPIGKVFLLFFFFFATEFFGYKDCNPASAMQTPSSRNSLVDLIK